MEIFNFRHGAAAFEFVLISIYLLFLFAEWMIHRHRKRKLFTRAGFLRNLTIGIIAFTINYLFTLASIPFMQLLKDNFGLFEFNSSDFFPALVLFVLLDFIEYVFHRLCHRINLFWVAHVVHHQSEEYNLTVGLRTSFLIPLLNAAFYMVFPLLGFSVEMLLLMIFIQGMYQLVIHSEIPGKWGILEKVLITPSLHRVHHGRNLIYLDKNYGKVLLIWDQLFGTYCPETEKPDFGVLNYRDTARGWLSIWNPVKQTLTAWRRGNKQERIKLITGTPDDAYRIIRKFNDLK
ncbi:MAG: sterol desaturase family protein [Bacteroidia bacterium]|jgi:sterol desaturase/sphingolipid hydroxylase (fatty acid hydroxylase superfamily)|nr:sterol desaturase family protein [Bacteroidia bacterium]